MEPLLRTSQSAHCTALWVADSVHFAAFFKGAAGVHRPLAGGSLGHLPSRQGQQDAGDMWPSYQDGTSSTPTWFAACAVWVSMWEVFPCLGLVGPQIVFTLTDSQERRNSEALEAFYSLWVTNVQWRDHWFLTSGELLKSCSDWQLRA